ncbi:MAG: polyphosphate kinase 2 family protein, partial [Dehalococcoidia bacterium]
LKFFLHIDAEEQKKRLQARLDEPEKRWKFNPDDLKERARWPEYLRAYEEVLSRTSTAWAPWYIIPANRKWYRDLVVSTIITERLAALEMEFPQPTFDPAAITIE